MELSDRGKMKPVSLQELLLRAVTVFIKKEHIAFVYLGLLVVFLVELLFLRIIPIVDSLSQVTLRLAPLFLGFGPLFFAFTLVAKSYLADQQHFSFSIFSIKEMARVIKTIWMPYGIILGVFFSLWFILVIYDGLILIPYLGAVISFFLGIIPFILVSVLLLYAFLIPFVLFVGVPIIALEKDLANEIKENFFARLLDFIRLFALFLVGALPFCAIYVLIRLSESWTIGDQGSLFTHFCKTLIVPGYLAFPMTFWIGLSVQGYFFIFGTKEEEPI